jgi:hypothetical protein
MIYIGDTFYTLSKGLVKASRMSDLKEINSLESPIEEQFSFRKKILIDIRDIVIILAGISP